MKRRLKIFWQKVLPIFLTLFSVTLLTVVSMLYAKGYRINIKDFKQIDNVNPSPSNIPISVSKNGILAVRSIPDAAKIYINDELTETTNATISSLVPGDYNVKVKKEGFETWEKTIKVYEDKVTDITALLVLKGGGLNPITNTGVEQFELSNNGEMLSYVSKGEAKPGIYLIQLSNSPINIFQSQKKAIVVDGIYTYSNTESIQWSPNDQELLLKIDDNLFYVIDLNKPANQIPTILTSTELLFKDWEQKQILNKTSLADTLNMTEEEKALAVSSNSVWSPDGDKFYIINKDEGTTDDYTVSVYNFEDPLPVSENKVNRAVKFEGLDTRVYWYSDSKHLLIVTKDKVKIVNIDGSNLFEVFSGEVIGAKAYPSPYGDRVIILSKFKTDGNANLYGVSIR